MEILKLNNINYEVTDKTILKNINLTINKGDLISLIGSSGSGKSTLLKLCSDLISQTSGSIIFNGKDFKDYNPISLRKEISYCIQSPVLFPDTVISNLKLPFEIRKQEFDLDKCVNLLEKFNLSKDYLNKNVKSLSGGEAQRIALLRNILFKPEILLLDEATSALDPENSLTVEKIIKDLNKSGVTILWATHNIDQSSRIFNKRITMSNGEIIKEEVF